MMQVDKFIETAKKIATDYKTLYVMGCIGAPLTTANFDRWLKSYSYNAKPVRKEMIRAACNTTPRTFGFDCVCLIKSILWGWDGNPNAAYGGAEYCSNGVPDINETGMINVCKNVSTDFGNITAGEVVYMPGHIGIYVGNGEVVECSPAWENGVQFTKLPQRNWTKHGFLPYVDYGKAKPDVKPKPEPKPSSFLGAKGYLSIGDRGENVRKLCKFMYDMFPGYASVLHRNKNNLLGNYYGENIQAWVKEFQRRTVAEAKAYGLTEKQYVDGMVGPTSLAILKKYGFKE